MKSARSLGWVGLAWLVMLVGVVAAAKAEAPSSPGPRGVVQVDLPEPSGGSLGSAMAGDRLSAPDPNVEQAAFRPCLKCRRRPCPPGTHEAAPEAEAARPGQEPGVGPTEPKPGAVAPEGAAAPPWALASEIGAAGGPASAAPHMIGDFFGGGSRFTGFNRLSGITNATVGAAGGDRRFKIVESNSPIPQDRLFFNFHHFVNPLVDVDNQPRDLNRYTFGVEKTLFGTGLTSVELRVPFTSGYDASQGFESNGSLAGTEFGNFSLAFKQIFFCREHFRASMGLGLVFPTGRDWKIQATDPQSDSLEPVTFLQFENDAVHLQPFLGALWQPNDRLFFQAFTQWDLDPAGSKVYMRDQGALQRVGVFQEQNLWYLDFNVGYWLYRNPCARWIKGMAPVVELHYATTMQDEDFVIGPQGFVGAPNSQRTVFGRRDLLNLTAGLHFQLGDCSTLTVAGVAPLRNDTDREQDAEVTIQFNRRF